MCCLMPEREREQGDILIAQCAASGWYTSIYFGPTRVFEPGANAQDTTLVTCAHVNERDGLLWACVARLQTSVNDWPGKGICSTLTRSFWLRWKITAISVLTTRQLERWRGWMCVADYASFSDTSLQLMHTDSENNIWIMLLLSECNLLTFIVYWGEIYKLCVSRLPCTWRSDCQWSPRLGHLYYCKQLSIYHFLKSLIILNQTTEVCVIFRNTFFNSIFKSFLSSMYFLWTVSFKFSFVLLKLDVNPYLEHFCQKHICSRDGHRTI